MLSYKTLEQARTDKAQLENMHQALNAAKTAFRRDDCDLWVISGKHGYISTWGDGESFHIVCIAESSERQWGADKKRLSFCRLTQNGDFDGAFRLDRLPTPDEAASIRKALGIGKAPNFHDEFRERLRARMSAVREDDLVMA